MFDFILLMAGSGTRTSLKFNKVNYKINNKELYKYSLEKVLSMKECHNVILVVLAVSAVNEDVIRIGAVFREPFAVIAAAVDVEIKPSVIFKAINQPLVVLIRAQRADICRIDSLALRLAHAFIAAVFKTAPAEIMRKNIFLFIRQRIGKPF